MGKASRSKGKRGELEACEALAEVWPGLKRTYHQSRSGSDAPDIDGPNCPVWIEVKRQERINIHEAMEQAYAATPKAAFRCDVAGCLKPCGRGEGVMLSRPPVIVHKRNRGEWLVTMRASDLKRLVGR